ncbi:MAG: pyridoxal 5'-phosphate synthase glutaminase subunit PdxT [Thermoprotei archaeon]
MRIGILGLQGGVYEHYYMLKRVLDEEGIGGEIVVVKKPRELEGIDGIVIPGGESTTIGVLARRTGILDQLRDLILGGLPAMGTCAGAILMAKRAVDRVTGKTSQPLLGVMDIEVTRNYFGRQRESFEIDLLIEELGDKPFRGVFIRAPAITSYWGEAEPLAKISWNGEEVVAIAREKHMLATVFHPELTNDTRIHRLFIKTIKK